jgi:site-specific DNA-methyltransferase (adenine-specific)
MENTLYYGDNLKVMRESIPDESVDLVYLDPPFNSRADYNVLYKDELGEAPPAQVRAFTDFWHWTDAVEEFAEIQTTAPERVRKLLKGMYEIIGPTPMMAYAVKMTSRLVEIHKKIKKTGSIYLHCDSTAGHYLWQIMEVIFGSANFQNVIVWKRFNFHANAKRWGRIQDYIIYFTKSPLGKDLFNIQRVTYKESYIKSHFKKDDNGRIYRLDNALAKGAGKPMRFFDKMIAPPPKSRWRWSQKKINELCEKGLIVRTKTGRPAIKRYLDEMPGHPIGDIWTDIPPINPMAKERLGYETQKPVALLERIINASSVEGDIVFDPFCGCGTTIEAAEKLNRKWIGIDITHHAISLVRKRLNDAFGEDCKYVVKGLPEDYPSAVLLAGQKDKYEFQWWALSLVGARPAGNESEKKKGADKGIDGIYPFIDDETRKSKIVIVSVKAGATGPIHIRELKGTVERENAVMGVLITLDPPTDAMRLEAATAGFYESQVFKKKSPKIQIISVKEYFDEGLRANLPLHTGRSIAFKKAPKVLKENKEDQNNLEI